MLKLNGGCNTGDAHSNHWGGLLLGFGFGLTNLGVSPLSGVLVWIDVSQTPASARA
jgi:hypothetical protein